MVTLLNVIIGGFLMGGIYAIVAVGLSMQYGVGRVLNIAHGEFLMVGAFITWSFYTFFQNKSSYYFLFSRRSTFYFGVFNRLEFIFSLKEDLSLHFGLQG